MPATSVRIAKVNGSQVASSWSCFDRLAVFDLNVRAVDDLITRNFTTALIDDCQRAVAIHGDALALAALDRLADRCT